MSCKRFSLPHKVVSLIIESVGWMQDKNEVIAPKTYNLYIIDNMEGQNSTWNFDKNEKIYSVIFKLPNYVSRVRKLEIASGWAFGVRAFEVPWRFRKAGRGVMWWRTRDPRVTRHSSVTVTEKEHFLKSPRFPRS